MSNKNIKKEKKESIINELKIFYNKTVAQNAEYYYDISKKYKKKIPGVKETIKNTEKELEELEKGFKLFLDKKEKENKIKNAIKKEWFEKFRFSFTKNGYLVVLGKDATTNEILLKKHMDNEDLVLHSDAPGSPFGLIKFDINFYDKFIENKTESNNESNNFNNMNDNNYKQNESKKENEVKKIDNFNLLKSKEEDILEAGQFLLSFSNFWKQGFGTGDFFVVLPEQVSKKAPSGEFMGKGSFMIYGEKKVYKNVPLKIGFGFYNYDVSVDNEIINYKVHLSSSPESCKKICEKFILLEPGNEKTKKINKVIKSILKINVIDLPKYIPNSCKIVKK